jgi:hypothetical protein
MQPNFEWAIETQKYFMALVTLFRVLFQQRRRQSSDNSEIISRPAENPTSVDLQDVYSDPDPPTPHWGC